MMQRLGAEFRLRKAHLLDPAVWPLAIFHFILEMRHAGHCREREFRCDAKAAKHAGKEAAASALIYIHVVYEMPWANLMDVLAIAASVGAPSTNVFSDQAARAAGATYDDWADIAKDELRKNTGALDSHPCLRERLEAIGATLNKEVHAGRRQSAGALARDRDIGAAQVNPTSAYQVSAISLRLAA